MQKTVYTHTPSGQSWDYRLPKIFRYNGKSVMGITEANMAQFGIVKTVVELPDPPAPPQPSEEVVQATAAIINRIAELVVGYDAIDDVKALENVNIESLLALAAEKGVTDEDMAKLKEDIVLLKTDLEGKMDANWYQIWNGWLKGAIADALQNMEEALRRSQAENEANQED